MSWLSGPNLLADAPTGGGYFALYKLIIMVLLVMPWLHVAGYLDKDLRDLNFKRTLWNCVIVFAGVLGLALWLIIPLYVVGLVAYLVLAGGGVVTYVVWRNARVDEAYRIFTVEHFKEMIQSLGKGEKKRKRPTDVEEKVRLKVVGGPSAGPPDEPADIEAYRTLQDVLFDAISKRASFVEIVEAGSQAKISYEIDGVSSQRDVIPREDADRFISLFKRICQLNVEERRRPQRAELQAKVGLTELELEVETAGSTAGETVKIRIIGEERNFTVKDLGFRKAQIPLVEQLVKETPEGIVLVGGTTGSGVSTTLYALLRTHDAYLNNIQTLETATLMELDNITQHVWKPGGQKNYVETLRSIIRQDPDVVMVARCTDADTAKQIIEGAKRGKKFYVGIDAPNAFRGLANWIRWVGDARTASQSIMAVTAQQLVRKLCPACREPYRPDPEMLRKANLPAEKIDRFYRPRTKPLLDEKGNPVVCPTCQGSGYFGRTAVFELLIISEAIRTLIAQGTPMDQIMRQARKEKMLTLQEEGLRRVIEGQTSINEILRSTRERPAKPARSNKARRAGG